MKKLLSLDSKNDKFMDDYVVFCSNDSTRNERIEEIFVGRDDLSFLFKC